VLIKRLAILALVAALAGCGGKDEASGNTQNATMTGGTVRLQGAGATFPQILYERWFKEYNRADPSQEVSYQGVGSGTGIKDFIAHTVDFGASDAAMSDAEMAKVPEGVFLLPMTAGSIVITYNLPGVSHLKLSRKAYVDIFLGKITKWNDPAITADNPGVSLPDKEITVAHRSDGSGTTFVFTGHLSAVSPAWKNGPGQGKSVQWFDSSLGGKGNAGVAQIVQSTSGAIGYVEYAYAKKQNLPMATLQNKAGSFVDSTPGNCSATLAAVHLPANMRAYVTDPDGMKSYPIVTYTWILAYKHYKNATKRNAVKKMLRWCLTEGQKLSPDLYYIPLPSNVVQKVMAAVDAISG
jgi:phosphate transport system substrate-binding protein